MKINYLSSLMVGFISLLLTTLAHAGVPLWTFTPLTATTLTIPANDTALIQYRITNQSNKPHTLSMKPIQGISQITTGTGICGSAFALVAKGTSCILSLQVNGSQLATDIADGPIVCQQGSLQCYRPSPADILHINVSTPPQILPALTSVNPSSGTTSGNQGVTLSGANLIGTTSVAFGGIAATFVNVIDSNTVTAVTPAHVAGAVDVIITTTEGSATLTNGFTYDALAIGQSSGGGRITCLSGSPNFDLIVSNVDNSTSIPWGGEGTLIGVSNDATGDANTAAIIVALGNNGGVPYAAQLCDNYEVDSLGNTPCLAGNACYTDWFLPARDQLACVYTNRIATGIGNFGIYWSSTEWVTDPTNYTWVRGFGGGSESGFAKNLPLRVRCVRSFTP